MFNLRQIISSIESNTFDIMNVRWFYFGKYPEADPYLLMKEFDGEEFLPPEVSGQTSLLISRLQVDYQKIINELGKDKIPGQVTNFYDINGVYRTELGELFVLATDNYVFKEDYDYTSRLKKVYRELGMLNMNLSIADLMNEKIRDEMPTIGTYHSNLNLNRFRISKKYSKKISKKEIKAIHLICINRCEMLVDVDYSNSEISDFIENNCDVEDINMTLHHEIGHLHFLKDTKIKKLKQKSIFRDMDSGGENPFGKNAEESFCDAYAYISTIRNISTMNMSEKEGLHIQKALQDSLWDLRWYEDPKNINVLKGIHHTCASLIILFSSLRDVSMGEYKNIDKQKISMLVACAYGDKYKSLNLIKEQNKAQPYGENEHCYKRIKNKLRYPKMINKIKDITSSYFAVTSVFIVAFSFMYSIMLLSEDLNILYYVIIYLTTMAGICYSIIKFNPFGYFVGKLSASNYEMNSSTKFLIQNELVNYLQNKEEVSKKSPIVIDYEVHLENIKKLLLKYN
jgi:hypothetical protein